MTDGSLNTYTLGDMVVLSVQFTDPATGLLADPPGVIVRLLDPRRSLPAPFWTFGVDPEVVKDAVGQYHMNHQVMSEGLWRYRWEGTGALAAATEGAFIVCESAFW